MLAANQNELLFLFFVFFLLLASFTAIALALIFMGQAEILEKLVELGITLLSGAALFEGIRKFIS